MYTTTIDVRDLQFLKAVSRLKRAIASVVVWLADLGLRYKCMTDTLINAWACKYPQLRILADNTAL